MSLRYITIELENGTKYFFSKDDIDEVIFKIYKEDTDVKYINENGEEVTKRQQAGIVVEIVRRFKNNLDRFFPFNKKNEAHVFYSQIVKAIQETDF